MRYVLPAIALSTIALSVSASAGAIPASGTAQLAAACSAPGSLTLLAEAVCEHVAGVRDGLIRPRTAEEHYRKALALWDRVTPPRPDFEATTLVCLADVVAASHRDAEPLYLRARQLAVSPSVSAMAIGHLGAFYGRSLDPGRGRPLLNEALARFGALPEPPVAELAYASGSLGLIDLGDGKYAAAEAGLKKALLLSENAQGPEHPETTGYEINLGLLYYIEGNLDRAAALLAHARAVVERRDGSDSLQAAAVYSELSAVEGARGKLGVAEDLAEQTLSILRRDHAPGSPEIALAEVGLGTVYLREGRTVDAAKILPEAVGAERAMNLDTRILADGIRRLADLRTRQRDWSGAESLYREALSLYEHRLGATHPDLAPVLRDYAEVLKRLRAPRSEVKSVEARARTLAPVA